MLFSTIAFLAIATSLAVAAPPAPQATYCSEDSLLRAFQHTPTPASRYCVATTGYPTFLAVATYPPTRLSSACSCFSRIPSETPKAAACTPGTKYSFSGYTGDGITVNLIITTTSATTACGGSYIDVIDVCGTYNNGLVSFSTVDKNMGSCLRMDPRTGLEIGIFFGSSSGDTILLGTSGGYFVNDQSVNDGSHYFATTSTTDVSCFGSSTCPAVLPQQ